MDTKQNKSPVLKYSFKTDLPGEADGVIRLEGVEAENKTDIPVTVCWSKNGAALADYTPLCTLPLSELEKGYVIDKALVIPLEADGIVARLTLEGNVLAVKMELPAEKLTKPYGKKLFTAALTSDYHFGGWGSKLAPKEGIAKGFADMEKYADVVFANGDLVQWHASFSEESFMKYNWDGKKYKDNGETSTEYLHLGVSQWQVLEDAFKTIKKPIYVTSGGHDVPDNTSWSKLCCTEKYYIDFLNNWINYSVNAGLYPEKVDCVKDNPGYDGFFKGCHFVMLQVPRHNAPHGRFGEDQLTWLDKVLFDREESGMPIFVFGHNPVHPDLAGRHGLEETSDAQEFVKILEKHPTAVYVSGHSHHTLDSSRRNVIDGGQNAPSFIHDGSMTTIVCPPTFSQEPGSHFVLAEVFSDYVLVRARDALYGRWISMGLSRLSLKDKCSLGEISVRKECANGRLIISADCKQEISRLVWFVDGVPFEGDTVGTDVDFDGYIALRAYDNKGGFKSLLFDGVKDI